VTQFLLGLLVGWMAGQATAWTWHRVARWRLERPLRKALAALPTVAEAEAMAVHFTREEIYTAIVERYDMTVCVGERDATGHRLAVAIPRSPDARQWRH
jgi:hypothetical protein